MLVGIFLPSCTGKKPKLEYINYLDLRLGIRVPSIGVFIYYIIGNELFRLSDGWNFSIPIYQQIVEISNFEWSLIPYLSR